jgi:hypothetical protein
MNNDDQFEQRLRRQELRPIPKAWREEILEDARRAAPRQSGLVREPGPVGITRMFLSLFWPHPRAWAGLAAVWVLILGLNFVTREAEPSSTADRAATPSAEMRRLLRQQEQLLAELVRETPDASEPKRDRTQPRSERRQEILNA